MGKFDYIKIKNFCSPEDTIKGVERQGTEQETDKVTNAYIHTM